MGGVELPDIGWNFVEYIGELVHEGSNEILTYLCLFVAEVEVVIENRSSKASSKTINDCGAALRALGLGNAA